MCPTLGSYDSAGLSFKQRCARLWARMIVRGCHSSKDVPPDIPTICSGADVAKAVSGATLI